MLYRQRVSFEYLARRKPDLFRDSSVSKLISRDTNFFPFSFFLFFLSDSESDKTVMRRSKQQQQQLCSRIVRRGITRPEYHHRRRRREGGDRGGGGEGESTHGAHFHRNSARMATPSNATIPQRNLECSRTCIYIYIIYTSERDASALYYSEFAIFDRTRIE